MFQVTYHGIHSFNEGTTIDFISQYFNIPRQYFYLIKNGKLKYEGHNGEVLDLIIRAHGGKGGFGALLKGKEIKSKKKENLPEDYYDMSRDLNTGKRIYQIRTEKELERKEERQVELKEMKIKKEKEMEEEYNLKKEEDILLTENTTKKLLRKIDCYMNEGGIKRKKEENKDNNGKKIKHEENELDILNPF
ncbi:hypothetical protein EHI8A_043360 [Entamoeba histolytica HM-1:IMSS-B]|uniref:SDE2-like domain-containing protein n=6 Tax=Entamoeba histolytica TaxID=5759 RepID=C4M958_ENTH1|nr:hypothetical protein EHI_140000 [Entamoeba histolytica HM-1:IMSS]EMD45356.1 Hypothetical protein EHI5A_041090 [Entamoeba histolytica KU27]EMH73473.1 hypothetical protein EHI8A_043360 [Entamoeba histolytica HM-1:IMSS-B]EMS18046.1 hypothetical protein KM1_048860 [Entamoeba histolytica HM-3:IMSS]ENY60237.1 hypothetical protein EHI7A_041280 [Entamoeba histolytica HM-1:IMSS-A]GAT98177.1 hypothetical protein CL6EHI_140000 [Entamoeba histolytica]|eukprot:XP_649542.1 hypothetical protein EHI_140000 [Entamoeba histolytica HM-1:IMSS]